MAHGKDRHYWAQLRAALTAGLWTSSDPAKTPHGSVLPWTKLIYKFNKHCVGFQDVAEIASQTQALSIWLSANAVDEDQLGSEPDGQLCLASECMLLPERVQEAAAGYEVLKKLQSTRSDSLLLALAYYAYAFGEPSECLDYLAQVPSIPDAQSHIPYSSTVRSDHSTLQPHSSNPDASTSWTGSFLSAESIASTTNVVDGRAWATTESIRSVCLQGMCHEKLHGESPELAIQAYATALPLLTAIESEIPRSLAAQGSPSSFSQYRELWRWGERVMFRAITLLARTRHLDEPEGLIWSFFSRYESCSTHWRPTFRTSHRSIVAVLHLRALIIQFRAPSPLLTAPSTVQLERPPQWLNTARSIINEYRTVLDISTRFPKAGERNVKVEDLVDLSVAVWEASGMVADRAQWVIDVLWWATRLTFNSYRVFRHMSRLLYVAGDTGLAKRTLRLYVEVVSKTRVAGVDGDGDTDRHWVETLVEGARMLCRLALSRPGLEGVEEAKEAGELLEKAKTRLNGADVALVARVALAEGIWNTVTAFIERQEETRTTRLGDALKHYTRSVEAFPTPSAHHHLALALALPGPRQNLEEAVTCARAAVEGSPNEIRHWHLLGLLLTAQGEWAKAQEVLDIGSAIDEPLSETDECASDVEGLGAKEGERGQRGREVRSGEAGSGTTFVHEMILERDAVGIPPSATLLCAYPDHPVPTPEDGFEYGLQLRLTQMALTEHVEGPEGAETKWVDVFGWIAERKGTVSETQLRSSMDTGSRSAVTRPGSVMVVGEMVETDLGGSVDVGAELTMGRPPPITVTPATPAVAEHGPVTKRRFVTDRDASTGKKMQRILKNRVHKGQAKISTISRKIGSGVVRNSVVKRASSTPDFHAVLENHQYQASSIHSRRPLRSLQPNGGKEEWEGVGEECPVPPPPPTPAVQDAKIPEASREERLLSELWASCAGTFRRLGKNEQAKGAIQEAEVKNEENPSVWVQLGLYHYGMNHEREAIEAFHKAQFVSPDDVSASVHVCRVYLTSSDPDPDKVEVSAGLLGYMSRGPGWDVPEVWYFLSKAHSLRGEKEKQLECLTRALSLSERRCIRDLGRALGYCL